MVRVWFTEKTNLRQPVDSKLSIRRNSNHLEGFQLQTEKLSTNHNQHDLNHTKPHGIRAVLTVRTNTESRERRGGGLGHSIQSVLEQNNAYSYQLGEINTKLQNNYHGAAMSPSNHIAAQRTRYLCSKYVKFPGYARKIFKKYENNGIRTISD